MQSPIEVRQGEIRRLQRLKLLRSAVDRVTERPNGVLRIARDRPVKPGRERRKVNAALTIDPGAITGKRHAGLCPAQSLRLQRPAGHRLHIDD